MLGPGDTTPSDWGGRGRSTQTSGDPVGMVGVDYCGAQLANSERLDNGGEWLAGERGTMANVGKFVGSPK